MRRRYITTKLPAPTVREIDEECARLEVSRSWLLRAAWEIARREVMELPTREEVEQ